MITNLNILSWIARIFFLCWFSVWSLSAFLLTQKVSFDISVQDESYLLASQLTSSFFNGYEENKKSRYPGENDTKYYSIKYPGSTGIHFEGPSGNLHYIISDECAPVAEICFTTDNPRPPPNII